MSRAQSAELAIRPSCILLSEFTFPKRGSFLIQTVGAIVGGNCLHAVKAAGKSCSGVLTASCLADHQSCLCPDLGHTQKAGGRLQQKTFPARDHISSSRLPNPFLTSSELGDRLRLFHVQHISADDVLTNSEGIYLCIYRRRDSLGLYYAYVSAAVKTK
jgi:hypothetical protein